MQVFRDVFAVEPSREGKEATIPETSQIFVHFLLSTQGSQKTTCRKNQRGSNSTKYV